MRLLARLIEALGARILSAVEELGHYLKVCALGVVQIFAPPWRLRLTFKQMAFVGVESLSIILITGAFTGAVFSLQAFYGFNMLGAGGLTGSTVALSLTRELGPTLTALMVAGRAGSAMAAEIGTMRVTEQIDAMEAMAVDPYDYIVAPRIIAGTLMVPALAMVFNVIGIFGSWVVGTRVLGLSKGAYLSRIEWYLDPDDITLGLAKAAVFGFIVASVGCFKGLEVSGGAEGVGRATTKSVVISSVSILIVDYFLTAWWMT